MGDHLAVWCEVRARVPWDQVRHGLGWPAGPVSGRRDSIAHRITTIELSRDPVRARRLLRAHELMCKDAADGRALDFDLLMSWQRAVLDVAETPFRGGPAFAKGGRERYGLAPDTPARFARCLAASQDRELPVAARAARVYLDVCFFHPFSDGNARSALLASAFVMARDGIVLDEVGPLAQAHRTADDVEGAAGLANLLVVLIEATQRRCSRDSHAYTSRT